MNCIILLLLLCCCGGCGNGVSGNSNGNCCCENNHCHHHHHHNHCDRERSGGACEASVREDICDCAEKDCDVASMAPPSWQDFPGLSRDCDCKE